MANNTITVTYKINEDGSLQRVADNAKKAAKATEDTGKAAKNASKEADNYSKKQKGVAQATSNGTKAFSKMTTGINSGLVPAYAEIAARVFALSAAFNVLSRNNAVLKLEESLQFTGRAAGRNLPMVAQSLREITGAAVSTEQAMKTVAIGISSGFSELQMEGLARVAKGASIALGRDMTDALDRLTRGAAKLEPEIVDELGIMVRLDDAVKNYAISINKSEKDLTQFERRMAFTNQIIDDGIRKFGDIADTIEPSAYDRLGASLSNISKTLVGGFSEFLAPALEFLSKNTLALGGLTAAYGGLVAGSIVGGLQELARTSALNASRTQEQADAALKAIKPNEKLGKAFNEAALSGDRNVEQLTRMQKSLKTTINMTSKDTAKLKVAKRYRNLLTAEIYKQNLAQVQLNASNAIGTLQEVGLRAGIAAHTQAMRELIVATTAASASQTGFAVALTVTRGVLTGVIATARFAFAALLTILPMVALIGSIVAIAWPLVKGLFAEEDDRLEKQIKQNTEKFEEFNKVVEQYSTTIDKAESATEIWIRTIKPIAGLFQEISTSIDKAIGASKVDSILKIASATEKMEKAKAVAKVYNSPFMSVGPSVASQVGGSMKNKAEKDIKEAGDTIDEVNKETLQRVKEEVARGIGEFTSSLVIMKDRLDQLKKQGKPAGDAIAVVTSSLKDTKQVFDDLLSGKLTPEEAATQIRNLATETNSAVRAFEDFHSILSAVKQEVGDVSTSWGTYGGLLDKTNEGLLSVKAILKKGGVDAAKNKAVTILEAMGIKADPDEAVQVLESTVGKIRSINQKAKDLELKSAKQGIYQGGEAAGLKEDSELALMLEKIQLQREVTSVTVAGSEREREEQLRLIKLVSDYNAKLKESSDILNRRAARLGGEGAGQASTFANTFGDLFNQQDTEGNTIIPSISDFAETLNTATAPMLETLSSLGPEGEVMSAAIQGALSMTEAFIVGFEQINSGGSKVQAGLMMAGAAVQALGALQQAQSNAAVSAIDKQIEAEKKRDGKSAASQAKLVALEKRKDAIKRKAFEQNKKMQMASTVINTATAIMAVMDDVPAPFNFVLAGLVGALGAAQLAAISSSSYQGGASSIPQGPSSINVGNRQNSVDLAKARSPAGELAYARGAQGTGTGMTNYTPAFTGTKYRASGGNTGFMVGEQGPELFIPDRPGRIAPADEVQSAGQPVNVNFSIQAVDSAGVEDLLRVQRGNIIGMIREAANSHGELFLENINDQALPVSRQSRRY